MIIFKSKLYREEIKHWVLISVLLFWGMLTTVHIFRTENKTILIAVGDGGTRLVTDSFDRALQSEIRNFVTEFINSYYSYNEETFSEQVGRASDLLSQSLWEQQKSKLFEIKQNLAKNPLSQKAEITKLELRENNTIEADLTLTVTSRLSEQKYKIKSKIQITKIPRSESNPWGYEITELKDETL